MEDKIYNNFPDKFVSKQQLVDNYFPVISIQTVQRRIKETYSIKQFRDISIGTGGKMMINVRGFFCYLKYKEKQKYR
ncbi:hypothetical protein [Streptococcus pneumoniae]|uniref:hypothetical protein n=1 Tax=Streptococcus pluranimalium TaxID=82348 RepID=UPI0013700DB7|nr:hypothetical protein [Streptococcus pneumoniae]